MKDIKILVCCHKDAQIIKNGVLAPVQVGAAIAGNKLAGMSYYDDDGTDNISSLNKKYCELTAQYYAWKYIDADYYGLFHYRRYLSFSHKYSRRAQYRAKNAGEGFTERFGLSEENITKTVEKYDVIMPKRAYYFVSNHCQYGLADAGFIKDLNFCLDVIKRDYPHMYKSAKKYMRSPFGYICNMFVMKKQIFFDYCKWLFGILKKFDEEVDCSGYSAAQYRVNGYLSERLLGIYVQYLKDQKKYRIKTLPRVFVKNTQVQER